MHRGSDDIEPQEGQQLTGTNVIVTMVTKTHRGSGDLEAWEGH